MRQKGYTLVELGFVIGGMLLLAGLVIGGASFLMNQSRGQQVVNHAKSLQVAVENYIQKNNWNDSAPSFTTPVVVSNGGNGPLGDALRPFLDPGIFIDFATAGAWYGIHFPNPYTGHNTPGYPITGAPSLTAPWLSTAAAGSYPFAGGANTANPAFYPMTTWAGTVQYFGVNRGTATNGTPYNHTSMLVWDGTTSKTFNYYAVQALDGKGQPLATLGR